MKDIVESMIRHPIATIIVIGSVSRGIAEIISAIKGTSMQPALSVKVNSDPGQGA